MCRVKIKITGTDRGHVLPRVRQEMDLRARVVVSEGHERAHELREGERDGDVVLRHARRRARLLGVHRGVAEHQGAPGQQHPAEGP